MPHRILLTLALLAVCSCAVAQDLGSDDLPSPPADEKPDTARFFIEAPARRCASHYNKLELIDQRIDTARIGLISTTNYYDIRVIPGRPLGEQFGALLSAMADSGAGGRTLLVLLKRFVCYDVDTKFGSRLCVALRISFFDRHGADCRQLPNFDTVVQESYSRLKGNLRKRIFATTSRAITEGMRRAMSMEPDVLSPYYTYTEVQHFDSAFRSRLPLFQRDSFAEGVYLHYSSFALQKPDYTKMLADLDGDKLSNVMAATPTQASVLLSPRQLYAVVWKGKAYISQGGDYYPLTRTGDDLYYTGKIRVNSEGADAIVNSTAIAAWAVSTATIRMLPLVQVFGLTAKKKFLLRLDFSDGSFVPVKAVK